MLKTLEAQNLILVDKLEIDFEDGFNVFTGETGAGKSIIIDIINFALGSRANNKLLKNKDVLGNATLNFKIVGQEQLLNLLSENDIPCNDEVILRRSLNPDGRSKCYINDVNVGVNLLAQVGECIIEICGQHESVGLLNNASHLEVLDLFGKLQNDVVKRSYLDWSEKSKYLYELKSKAQSADIEIEYLKNIISEIESLNPKKGEEDILAEKRKILSESGKINEALENSIARINEKILPEIYNVQKNLTKHDDLLAPILAFVNQAEIDLKEASSSLDDKLSSITFPSESLDQIEERLFKLRSMARKNNATVDDLLEVMCTKRDELVELEKIDTNIRDAEKEVAKLAEKFLEHAKILSLARHKTSKELEKQINLTLKDLKMEKAEFRVDIVESNEWRATGIDVIKFMIRTNVGQQFGTLAHIASGGELSRILLALKISLNDKKSTPVLIFDEIDTGISGSVSDAVGKKLKELAGNAQVFCVTHQPQVAVYANHHYQVSKESSQNNTTTKVHKLSEAAKQSEIARLLSGEIITDESLLAAQKLLQTAA